MEICLELQRGQVVLRKSKKKEYRKVGRKRSIKKSIKRRRYKARVIYRDYTYRYYGTVRCCLCIIINNIENLI